MLACDSSVLFYNYLKEQITGYLLTSTALNLIEMLGLSIKGGGGCTASFCG